MHSPSHDDGATVGNGINHVEAIAAAHLSDRAMLPLWEHILFDPALNDMPRPVLGLVPLQPFLEHAIEVCGAPGFRISWIAPGANCITSFAPSIVRAFN